VAAEYNKQIVEEIVLEFGSLLLGLSRWDFQGLGKTED
jgi:hypothetical protein